MLGTQRGDFQNLPDSWPSRHVVWITPEFAWSHGVILQDNARLLIPQIPQYAAQNQRAAEIMYQRYLKSHRGNQLAYDTALGFLGHFAEDANVHWTFSPGGTYKGWIQHPQKERWADYIIFIAAIGGSFRGGKPVGLPTIANKGDADLISEAQADFIANKVPINTRKETLSTGQPAAEISSLLQTWEVAMKNALAHYNYDEFHDLSQVAAQQGWAAEEVLKLYDQTVRDVRNVYESHPP